MKVKIFTAYSSDEMQNEINAWLETHEKIVVEKVRQSVSGDDGYILIISIFYSWRV
jgi:hypothetical protein